ncbi:MAG: galactokinase [Chloroflexi bacterium]|nr:galactokinase [Chloroflexota bacterium]
MPQPLEERVAHLQRVFTRQFGVAPSVITRAPGRVNLIGEHTDYNDGFVLPLAIQRDTLVAARARVDGQVRAYSATLRSGAQWYLRDVEQSADQPWSNYLRGLTKLLPEAGVPIAGADLAIASTVPLGAGVSSSAALEMATGTALLSLAETSRATTTLALLCQRVENEFVGVRTGIMDQFVSGLAQAQHLLLLDCRTQAYEYVPLPDGFVIGVADTGVEHGLVASEYNRRRAECELGVAALAAVLPGIRALRDVSVEDFVRHEHTLIDPVRRRCRHVVTENARVLETVAALRAEALDRVGELMYASHTSLRDDYEVSIPELDTLVEAGRGVRGVVGSRMTGGGFGGSTVTLVEQRAVNHWSRTVRDVFRQHFGRIPRTFITTPAQGASIVWHATD